MALQGSIDTFALADVLRLLASTGKTGRLALDGDRGSGQVVVVDGAVAQVSPPDPSREGVGTEEALFELLRFEQADFVFNADDEVRHHEHPGSWPIDELLDRAYALLGEWRDIESVLPSGGAWLTLRHHLDGDHITIGADAWPVLVVVGSGATARAVGEALAATELAVGRQVRTLVELGAIEVAPEAPEGALAPPIEDPVAEVPAPADGAFAPVPPDAFVDPAAAGPTGHPADDPSGWSGTDPSAWTGSEPTGWAGTETTGWAGTETTGWAGTDPTEPVVDDPAPAWDEPPVAGAPEGHEGHEPGGRIDPMDPPAAWFDEVPAEGRSDDTLAADAADDAFGAPLADLAPEQAHGGATSPGTEAPVAEHTTSHGDPFASDDHDAADFARQLASLSPKAAKAVAAAALAPTPEERDRALAEVEQGDDGIDHELLLRFLGADQD